MYHKLSKQKGCDSLKITLNKIESGEDELIINYREMTDEVKEILRVAEGGGEKIPCVCGETKYMLPVGSILYAESVERMTFLYTDDGIFQSSRSLQSLELLYAGRGFFRCSKSMIVNIYRIAGLRSESGGRISAVMENGESVIISRSYAKAFRRELRGEE